MKGITQTLQGQLTISHDKIKNIFVIMQNSEGKYIIYENGKPWLGTYSAIEYAIKEITQWYNRRIKRGEC